MYYVNLIILLLVVNSIHISVSWGFAAERDEVLKPQLRSALNATALRQPVRSVTPNAAGFRPRFNTGNRTVAGLPPGVVKEETTERVTEQNSREVTETQHATCKISTEELVATAQATVTRVLKGLCNTTERDEVLKPQLRSALNATALRQPVRSVTPNAAGFRPRFNTGNRTVAGLPPGVVKEETTERVTEQNSREVTETQHATCKISTEELVATAQATVTRVLKGLCNTKEMEDRFHNLEIQLAEQLNVIKTMLLNIEDRITEQDQLSRRGQRRIMATLLRQCQSTNPISSSNSGKQSLTTYEQEEDGGTGWNEEESSNEISEGPRDKEVERYNSTIHAEPIPGQTYSSQRSRAFTYYWRVHGMEYKLTGWNHRRSLRSPSFYISPGGYRMYIRMFPHQNEENVYVHVGVTRGDYDDNLPWPFKLKHRINILDQISPEIGAQEDISSRVWDPTVLCSGFNWQKPTTGDNYECVGLGFPHNVIRSRNYIRDDLIIIKLTVYLD
ncbi:hypothetical protein C0J52_04357 [Blattella germanica]|nr:hypothetical protein C0J52_04357 [Blattella germanica]